jgi:hypothetical protein
MQTIYHGLYMYINIMCSKVEYVILNGHNYGIWAQYMDTRLKNKVLWQFTKTMIRNLKDDQH